jgi:MYXO-CTERM domain-containing protein
MSFLLRSLAAAVLSLCLVAGSARASQVVFGNLGSDGLGTLTTTAFTASSQNWLAQGFTVGGTNTFLSSISIGLLGTGTATVSLYSSLAGIPDQSLVSVSQAIASEDPALVQSFSFNNFSLTNGASYWVVVNRSGGGWFSWVFNADEATPSGQNSSGWVALSPATRRTSNGGSTWTSSGANTFASFSISASSSPPTPEPIPEPGTWAAAALLIGAAAYVRWRRRPQAA